MNFRKIFSGAVFFILLLWGPINHTWPGWIVIRIGYLILVPLLCSFILKWLWDYFQPSKEVEDTLERTLWASISLILWTVVVLTASGKKHWENTKWVQTRDGREPIGEDVLVRGPDIIVAIILGLIAIGILWFGVIWKNQSNKK